MGAAVVGEGEAGGEESVGVGEGLSVG
ncbi:hypothetical protein GA0115240_10501, partial [Streptomyces sp. DvalAA-14]